VTLAKDFIDLPLLRNDLTDTHFAKRDRLGRSLGFLARIVQDNWSARPREIAVDEKSAVLVEPDGKSRVIGPGRGAYFISITQRPDVCQAKQPLTMSNIRVHHAPGGQTFDLRSWAGSKGQDYTLAVDHGVVHSSKGNLY
jgi:cyanophycinase-like exopeptidase